MRPSLKQLVKRLWMKAFVGIEQSVYQNDYARLEKAYKIKDPWDLSSPRERFRYMAVNELIRQQCGVIGSILEIGSGEGHHTQYLLDLSDHIAGIEVSPTAIARAKQRCPTVHFFQACFPHLPIDLQQQYDLVIASEVLYYMRDVEGAISSMSQYGRFCLASCYQREIQRFDQYFRNLPGIIQKDLQFESFGYRVYLWQPSTHTPLLA